MFQHRSAIVRESWFGLLDVCTTDQLLCTHVLTDSLKIPGRDIEASQLYIIRGDRDHHRKQKALLSVTWHDV
jgi:hypothetical protein